MRSFSLFILFALCAIIRAQQPDPQLSPPQKGVTTIRHIEHKTSGGLYETRRMLQADSLIRAALRKMEILSNTGKANFSVEDYDKLVTFDNEVLFVKVQSITLVDVNYLFPLNVKVESLGRDKISQIIYANGNIDLFIPFDEAMRDSLNYIDDRLIVHRRKAWEQVKITEAASDIEGLHPLGSVSSVYVADKVQASNSFLEKNGLIILKKRAANLEADIILINRKSYNKGYGSYPSIRIEGIAYKFN